MAVQISGVVPEATVVLASVTEAAVMVMCWLNAPVVPLIAAGVVPPTADPSLSASPVAVGAPIPVSLKPPNGIFAVTVCVPFFSRHTDRPLVAMSPSTELAHVELISVPVTTLASARVKEPLENGVKPPAMVKS